VTKADLEFQLENEIGLIPQFVDLIQRTLASLTFCDTTESIRLSLAIEEALLNALIHGNLELTSEVAQDGILPGAEYFKQRASSAPYKDRMIHVRIRVADQQLVVLVEDEGPGFDTSRLPAKTITGSLQDGLGRGLTLMRCFMDEVIYNPQGNALTLIRQFS
jgi:anti-sigma regulatory factor (Ser/Thr protein kinase)